MYFFKFFIIFLNLIIASSECSSEFIAHNFVNYNVRGNDYGLPSSGVHGKLRQFLPEKFGLSENSERFGDELVRFLKKNRNWYMLKVEDVLTKKFYWHFFKNVLKTNHNGLLLLVPKRSDVPFGKNKVCDEAYATDFSNSKLPKCKSLEKVHQDTLSQLEHFLYKSKPKCSVSVTELDENTLNILNNTKSSGGLLNDDMRVVAKQYESTQVNDFLTINLYGELKTSPELNKEEADQDKTKGNKSSSETTGKRNKVLVTASLDTFGVLQTYSSNSQFNTGLVLLLELSRLLKDVKSEVYDLLFLLYSGSVVDYSGLRHFLKSYKGVGDVSLVVNFSDLSGENLYLHLLQSNQQNLDHATKVFLSKMNIESLIKEVNNPYEGKKNKDDESEEGYHPQREDEILELSLPNEVDFYQNHNSMTITSTHDPVPLHKRCYSLNYEFDVDLLTQRVVDAAKAFAQLLKAPPLEVNVEEVRENVKKWQEKLAEPRNNLSSNLLLLKSVKEVLSHLESNLGKIQIQNFRTVVSVHKLYTSSPNKCLVYKTKHPAFDLVVFAAVALYILVVWSVSRGSVKLAIDDVVELIQMAMNEKNFKFGPGKFMSKYS